jgi:phospholipase C
MPARSTCYRAAGIAATFLASLGIGGAQAAGPDGLKKIDHILVVYLENRSFDNLYGLFPGANGLAKANDAAIQVDKDGAPYATLPPVMDTTKKPAVVDDRFPKDLGNKPFDIGNYVPLDQKTGDMVHRFYQEQQQIDGGKMDKFAAFSDGGGLVMGYYVVCVCVPKYANAPADMVVQLDARGMLVKDGAITPDGYAVNTMQTTYQPHSAKITDPAKLLPPQDGITIGDRLTEKGVSWAWYSGGWNDALAGKPDELFQFHHQPFAYFKQFGDGTDAKKQHLKDEADMLAAIADGTLPAVSFWKPIGAENEHPGYANVSSGDQKVADVLEKLEQSPLWAKSAVIITYDENGGSWDHVSPPKIDSWGPGTRVPTLIVSPLAKRGFVDHTLYDTTSILKLIEERYDLQPLGARDAGANDLTNAFAF